MKRVALALLLFVVLSACGQPERAPGPSPSPFPSVSGDEWRLRYRLLDRYRLFWCDPDAYPVGVSEEELRRRGLEWYGQNSDTDEATVIREHLGYREPLSTGQKLNVYADHKKLRAIDMQRSGSGFRFRLVDGVEAKGDEVRGIIDRSGRITETVRRETFATCPICLEPGTRIATPHGEIDVALLRRGDLVWTVDRTGRRVTAPLVRVVRRPVPAPHAMMGVRLRDGRALLAAPRHPLPDGTLLGSLRAGDILAGSVVAEASIVLSNASATYDLLPAGETGLYFANGILVGSTLKYLSNGGPCRSGVAMLCPLPDGESKRR